MSKMKFQSLSPRPSHEIGLDHDLDAIDLLDSTIFNC